MEKKAQLYEIIIKFVFAIFSFIAAVFVVKNVLSMLPLFSSYQYDEPVLYKLIYSTHFGDILKDMNIITKIDFLTIVDGFVAFLANIELIGIVFLILTLVLLVLHFIFIKWSLLDSYLKISGFSIMLYIFKHLFFVIIFGIFYRGGTNSMALSFVIGTSFYLLFSWGQLFFFCLWIIKFIFNIVSDIKYYCSH